MTFRKFGSRLQGHPTPALPWVDVATGSLGQGFPIGVGVALAGKYLDKISYRVWVLLGDSEVVTLWGTDMESHLRVQRARDAALGLDDEIEPDDRLTKWAQTARQFRTTKSPGATPTTSGPIASTTPAASWPSRNGKSSLMPPSR